MKREHSSAPSYMTYLFDVINDELREVSARLGGGADPEVVRPRIDELLDWRAELQRRRPEPSAAN